MTDPPKGHRLTWGVWKVDGGYQYRVYSVGHNPEEVVLTSGVCADKSAAVMCAWRWHAYYRERHPWLA